MMNLIILSGLPGTGKSIFAEKLAHDLQIPIFSVDPVESAIIKSGFKKSFKTGLSAYLVAEALANEQLKLGISVIIDAVNGVKEAWAMWEELAKKNNTKLVVIECICSDKKIHQRRIEKRVRNLHGIPEVKWEDVENRGKEYLPWGKPHLVLDTIQDQSANLEKAIKYIKHPSAIV
jgi:predicted kinase